jgi:hypothetical protein
MPGEVLTPYFFCIFYLSKVLFTQTFPQKVCRKMVCAASAAAWMAYPSGSLECANFSVMHQGTGYFSDGNGNAGGYFFSFWWAPGRTHQTEDKRLLPNTPMRCAFVSGR